MQITAKTWNEYITRLSRLNQKAGQLMREYIGSHGTESTDDLMIAYAYGLVTKYGEGSAELACQMYEALAEAQGVYVPAAEPAATASYGEVARMVNATKNQNPANLPNGVSRLVKRTGADTTLKNAVRDGAEWAWVPHGDTCPFCITLASNGWQKASSKVLKGGHAEHIHANCDCEFAIRFDHNTTVAGYDPEKYLAQYNAGRDINKMRRVNYAANKERINAQKRAAYAARKGYTNQAASAILDTSNKIGVDQDVNFVCKIDRSLYRIVEQDLVTDEVIITEQQILHIEEGHPGDYNRLAAYIPDVLQQPDYILRGNRPHTALVLKQISTPEMTAEVVLRLKVSGDPEEYKNSIITMWNISQKRFRRLLRQSEILYKKE